MIIDGHMHIGFAHKRYPLRIRTTERLVEVMDEYNVAQGVVSSLKASQYDFVEGNEELAREVERFPGRFIPVCTVNPRYRKEAEAEVRKYVGELGWKAVKLHPVNHNYAADCLDAQRIVRLAGELGAVVMVHSTADELSHPRRVAALAAACPNTKIVLVHMGALWAWWDAVEAAIANPNIYINTADAMFCDGQVEHAVEKLGAERIMWGSNLPTSYIAPNLVRITCADISQADKDMILGGSVKRLLTGK